MEQVGTSGLPPLLPSVPVPVPVADTEQAVEQTAEQDVCNLTELVPVRSKQPTSATDCILSVEDQLEEQMIDDPLEEQLAEVTSDMSEGALQISSTDKGGPKNAAVRKIEPSDGLSNETNNVDNVSDTHLDTVSETASETHSEAHSETSSGATSSTPTFQVPPHLLGRTVENPTADIPPGRRTQKPRLGVRVPYRNLTSQIVTQNEIAQEIFERAAKKHPGLVEMLPEAKKIAAAAANTELFTRKLTQRLANSMATVPQPAKPKTVIVPESIGPLKALLPNKQPAAVAEGVRLSPGFTYNDNKDKAMDDAELLSILEGDGDGDGDPLWLPDKLLRKAEGSTTTSTPAPGSLHAAPPQLSPQELSPPAPRLDPALEKELALKQLMELPIKFPSKKPEKKEKEKSERTPRRRGGKMKKEAVENEENASAPPPPTLEPAAVSNVQEPEAVPNGESIENAPPETPLKKMTSRKRKMTPEVAAVLKKPKLTKKAEAVANGKAKPGKAALIQGSPTEGGKRKTAGNRKTPQVKTVVDLVVTNGSDVTEKKKIVRRVAKGKAEDATQKTPVGKTPPTKTVKSSRAANKSQSGTPTKPPTPAPSPKHRKSVEPSDETPIESQAQAMEVVEEPAAPALTPVEGPAEVPPQHKKTRINRELEHLLGDEGAVNMLYAVEGHSKRKAPSKDLALKARLVKTAVMRLSTNPQGHMPLTLRARRSMNVVEPPKLIKMSGNRKQRHHSSESVESMRSPPYLTPVDGSHMFASRQKLTADDSRIIRRHSSSSSFSSPSVSPRRVSVEDGNLQSAAASTSGSPRKKGVPIFIRDKAKASTYDGRKKPKVVNPVADPALIKERLLELQSQHPNLLPNPAALKSKDLKKITSDKSRVKADLMKKYKKGLDSPAALRVAKLHKARLLAERKAAEELAKAQKAADEIRLVQQEAGTSENVLPIAPTNIKQEGKKNSAPLSPDAASYSNLLKNLTPKGKKAHTEERQRATARHCAGTYTYKEITVRRYENIVHITLAPVSTKMSSALNVQVLRELKDALQQVRKDDQCRVVLLTSSGSIFCQGIDLSALIHNNSEKRKSAAFDMSLALKDFLKCLAHFPKPLVAGVQGAALGLGVTMLPLFDMVFASDKATFHTPYAQRGQVPEGGATLTLPYMLGHTATSELLFNCRKLTANEALQFGLVTRVLWPDQFLEQLIPAVKSLAQQSAQSMEATKALLRHGLRTKFDAALESETHLLVTHWTSKECQASFQHALDKAEVCLQRQRAGDA